MPSRDSSRRLPRPRRNEDMNEKDSEAPFPREPWKRLLESSGEDPPETTDARIRAAARRDLVTARPALVAARLARRELRARGARRSIRNSARSEGRSWTSRTAARAPRSTARSSTGRKRRSRRAPGQSPKASVKIDLPRAAETDDDEFGAEDSRVRRGRRRHSVARRRTRARGEGRERDAGRGARTTTPASHRISPVTSGDIV